MPQARRWGYADGHRRVPGERSGIDFPIAYRLLGESLVALQIAGEVVVLAGIFLSRRGSG